MASFNSWSEAFNYASSLVDYVNGVGLPCRRRTVPPTPLRYVRAEATTTPPQAGPNYFQLEDFQVGTQTTITVNPMGLKKALWSEYHDPKTGRCRLVPPVGTASTTATTTDFGLKETPQRRR